ncbi:MAG: methionyl-tRNA formyltransferase [Rikenellaceae bacterium]|jgi:methionyl-tRNA formyltransferase|nr:methionyl-tRNA formyltransferase [Rikenellaceae bacterium]
MTVGRELRIIYMGTPEFAVASLRRLVEAGYNVVAVVTVPDKPAGRGLHLQPSAVKEYAMSAGLPVLQPEKLRDPAFVEAVHGLRPDLGIVIAFRMLPEVVWSIPRLGTFNLHASLLPQYRGAAPINWPIINGETLTGVTTFLLNSEIDKGDILARTEVAIAPEETAGTLHDKLMAVGCDLVEETVELLASGGAAAIPQLETDDLRPAPKIFRDDCRIDWGWSGGRIVNLVRGLSPYPAAWSVLAGPDGQEITVKIFEALFTPGTELPAGSTVRAWKLPAGLTVKVGEWSAGSIVGARELAAGSIVSDGKSYIRVVCADGWVTLKRLQLAGKKILTAEELLRGFKASEYRME